MIHVYERFAREWMAVPVVVGHKSPNERFAGAEDTLTIEALMQDGKALQSGTSHFLGQNFAKAFDVQYVNKEGKLEYVWATSWGVSTRLMGALIMAHSDNNGLVLPPKLAPIQVAMVPIYKTAEQLAEIVARFETIAAALRAKGISVKIDDRDNVRPGFKFAEYELKGVPVRLAMGGRDLENGTVELVRRDTLEKETLPQEGLAETIERLMTDIQENIYRKAQTFRDSMITKVDTWEEFKRVLDERAASSRPTGTARRRPKWRSRMPRKPRSAASRSTHRTRRAPASSRASRRTAACSSPAATKRFAPSCPPRRNRVPAGRFVLHRAGKTHPHRPPGPPRRTALLHANTAPSLPAVTDALLAANSRRRALSAGSPYRLTPHTAATARHHLHLTPPPPLAAASPQNTGRRAFHPPALRTFRPAVVHDGIDASTSPEASAA